MIYTSEGALIFKDFCIITDLHLGIGDYKLQERVILERLNNLKEIYNYEKLIILGDIKHNFGKEDISFVRKFLKKLKSGILIKGNHDFYLENAAKNLDFEVHHYYKLENYVLTHGHKLYEGNKFIIGHVHPAIKIKDFGVYKYQCFCYSENLIVLPCFNPFSYGANILEEWISPYYDKNLKIKVIAEDELIDLGKLENIKNYSLNT
jgi:putative SbcD/Mre11-related phosphoesterase